MKKKILFVLLILSILFLFGCTEEGLTANFKDNGNEVCKIEGKPVVRLYSTTECPHCQWVGPTYEKVVNEYVLEGKIVAMHWEVDLGDDTLTPVFEGAFPASEAILFKNRNEKGYVPKFDFGCKYERIGNPYEQAKDLVAEEAEFRRVIELLLNE